MLGMRFLPWQRVSLSKLAFTFFSLKHTFRIGYVGLLSLGEDIILIHDRWIALKRLSESLCLLLLLLSQWFII